MSNEARDRWSDKKCPFGVGNDSGKCCTTECAAWREWDTRETVTDEHVEESWEDSRPGWFSDWRIVDTRSVGGYYVEGECDPDTGVHREWVRESTQYLWRKVTTSERDVGSTGGYCVRLHEKS